MSYERFEAPHVPPWKAKLALYWQLVRGDRPIGWLLLLWPTWWGLWLAAEGVPPLWTLVVFSVGVWLTRSAGCVINDYADRWLDPHVERTKERPLATGAVSGREALLVFAVLMLVAFALVLTLNRLTIYLSVVGVLLAASYPYLKRYTYLPQVYLGLAFGWGIPMAFAAIRGEVPAAGLAAVLRQHRCGRPPTTPGTRWSTATTTCAWAPSRPRSCSATSTSSRRACCTRCSSPRWRWSGSARGWARTTGADWAWRWCWSAYEFWIARSRERDACFRAFLHNHWVGAVVFAGLGWTSRCAGDLRRCALRPRAITHPVSPARSPCLAPSPMIAA